ncbi:MAG: UpxY family transcription antiterminator [Candidatus Cryptobacteroides sp.]
MGDICTQEIESQGPKQPERRWFALKVFYNRVFEVQKILEADSIETYVPVRKESKTTSDGRKIDVEVPVISSLMFIKSDKQYLKSLVYRMRGKLLPYCNPETHKPSVIPDREMGIFMFVTSAGDKGLEYINDESFTFDVGQKVRVTGGLFKGAEGYIKRIKGNRRLVVRIEGVVAVATSYIPSCFIEKL